LYFAGSAWDAKLFVLFVLVPSFGACRAFGLQIDRVCVSSFWADGAILFGSIVGGVPCGLTKKVLSRGTTKNCVSGREGGAGNG